MCGFAGFYVPRGMAPGAGREIALSMRESLYHRGPDDSGLWIDDEARIALAHRRLSIIDLTSSGHQPMMSSSGRYYIAFNGEIYNHLELRSQLNTTATKQWRGSSDTETLLMAIETWGLPHALQLAVGMFAFALWDRERCELTLVRDRMGEKPLYYGWQGGVLLFGSELKALKCHPRFKGEIDRDVLPLYLRHGFIPAPWSIWRGIKKLLPGSYVTFSGDRKEKFPDPVAYWSFVETALSQQLRLFEGKDNDAIDALADCLGHAVGGQMIADVPLGAFLSGGIDSSVVVALMQERSRKPIHTYSIGFKEHGYDESQHAKKVASHLGTIHTDFYVTASESRDVLTLLPDMYDEPFGDSSAIPTHLVSYLARQHVTVALSGDGGDEVFGGYGRYFNQRAERKWRTIQSLPKPIVGFFSQLANRVSTLPGSAVGQLVPRLQMFVDLAHCPDYMSFYRRMTSQWQPLPISFQPNRRPYGIRSSDLVKIGVPLHQMMANDTMSYLPDDILVKVDRAAMSVSLETRAPLLDHRIVEFAWSLPPHFKSRNGSGKWILKQLLYRYVPKELVDRPKMGFGVPVDDWMRGPLREWAEYLLDERRLFDAGLNPGPVRRRWHEHLTGSFNWRDSLWLVLMWQAWAVRHGMASP